MKFKNIKVFQVPIIEWLYTKDLLVGLVLSSVFINMTALVLPLCLLQIYDRIIPNESTDTLNFLVLAVVLAVVIGTILKIGRAYVSAWADARLSYLSGLKAFQHIMRCDLIQYEKEGIGTHIERVNAQDTIKDFFGGQAIMSIIDLPFVLLFLVAIAYIDIRLLAIPLFIQMILGICIHVSGKNLHHRLQKRATSTEKRLNFVVEVLSGIHTVKALGMEPQIIRRYERLQHTAAKEDYKLVIQNAKSMRLTMFAQQINIILIITFGSFFVMQNSLTIGGLTACILLSGRIIQPISAIIHLWSKIQLIKISHKKNEEIHNMPLECDENAKVLDVTDGLIEFENISFRYSPAHPWILKNASFTIQKNRTTLILSDGFSGKSSILGLVSGLLHKESGIIKIDGFDIGQCDSSSLRKHIGYLPQNGILFSGTILENLTLFNVTENHEQAIKLSQTLGLDEIILQMPDGYQTHIGKTSSDVISQGIKQRILIIRSLILNPKIILFDEANSALDMYADKLLKEYLISIQHSRTIIMVTHRPSFAKLADNILLLRNKKFERLLDDEYKQFLN
tara:strand:+ start:11960 stop:13654 length:1695 start_codon:yes stop_codon:yes gene_type:complete